MKIAWERSTIRDVTLQCDYGISCGLSTDPVGVPVLRMGNLQGGRVLLKGLKYVPSEQVAKKDLLGRGDILLNRTNSADLVGKVGLFASDAEITFASYLFRIRADPARAHAEWLTQLLGSPPYQARLRELATPGVSQTNINREVLRNLDVPLPPLPEQRKIAAILSSVDDAIEGTQAVIDQLQVVKKAMMAELLTRGLPGRHTRFKQTEIGEVPEGWEVRPLEQWLARVIDYRGQAPPKHHEGTCLVTAKNVRVGHIDPEPREYIANADYSAWMKRGIPEQGDVLFTTEAPLGNAASVPVERIALGQRLITLCPDRRRLGPTFLLWALLAPAFQSLLHSKSTGSTVKGIRQSTLRTLEIAIPPMAEQRTIAHAIQSAANCCAAEESLRDELVALKSALMSVLLTGELRVTPDEAT